ncbi:MAG: glycosyltransferase [Candidatus Sedimenticola sp. (ex Thyasira tokunagai)]
MPSSTKSSILVGVCTYQRPNLFHHCISSLASLQHPENSNVSFVFVDNEGSGLVREIVNKSRASFGNATVYYEVEPERGISNARNCILKKSIELKTDWVAMIDDDEVVAKDWLCNLMSEAKKYSADVISGFVVPKLPKSAPRFFEYTNLHGHSRRNQKPSWKRSAASGNVMISTAIFKDGLSFDPQFNFTGGEDTHFFRLAHLQGVRILKTDKAEIKEIIPVSKATTNWYFKRKVGSAEARIKIAIHTKGLFWGGIKAFEIFLPSIVIAPISGVLYLLHPFFQHLLIKHVGRLIGVWNILTRKPSNFYLNVYDAADDELSDPDIYV